MEDKSTHFNSFTESATSQQLASKSQHPAGSPRQSTLELIRRFARAYHCTRECTIPAGMILN